ncbi:hypothetical protein EYF80_055988 [Liparis tanakae]|uniref:Uncharacterized protein n=1 Tax=Liparis tanakae TaxID=230148 RepID=A0A4Z2EYK9_9TELE|nr:hypothetical protein EYF80_055988 [Liparis tanakae]
MACWSSGVSWSLLVSGQGAGGAWDSCGRQEDPLPPGGPEGPAETGTSTAAPRLHLCILGLQVLDPEDQVLHLPPQNGVHGRQLDPRVLQVQLDPRVLQVQLDPRVLQVHLDPQVLQVQPKPLLHLREEDLKMKTLETKAPNKRARKLRCVEDREQRKGNKRGGNEKR